MGAVKRRRRTMFKYKKKIKLQKNESAWNKITISVIASLVDIEIVICVQCSFSIVDRKYFFISFLYLYLKPKCYTIYLKILVNKRKWTLDLSYLNKESQHPNYILKIFKNIQNILKVHMIYKFFSC